MAVRLAVALLVVTAVFGIATGAVAQNEHYSGTLTWSDTDSQITATDEWIDGSSIVTNMFWEVDHLSGNTWQYHYMFTVPAKGISHVIIETTSLLPRSAINVIQGNLSSDSPREWTSDQGNPGMLESLYGLKFSGSGDVLEAKFTVDRAPVWGDFYAKDGGGTGSDAVIAYNADFNGAGLNGFVIRDGTSADKFLAVPDGGAPPVPEVSSLALGLMGLVSSGGYLLKRRR